MEKCEYTSKTRGENVKNPHEKQQESVRTMNIKDKYALTVNEAAEYFGIGRNKITELLNERDCPFVLHVGSKRLVKRTAMEQWLDKAYSI